MKCSLCFLLLVAEFALAAPATINVSGTGRVMIKPDSAEILLSVTGQSEIAEDAIKKYDQALKQAQKALVDLKMKNLKVELLGLGVSQVGQNNQMVFNGQAQNDTKQPISFVKKLRVTVKGVKDYEEAELSKTLAKVLDTAKDAGASVHQDNAMAQYWGQQISNSLVHFVVTGIDEAREQAYAEAMQKARKRADTLAKLAGKKITGVHSIDESFTLPVDDSNMQTRMIYAMYGMQQKDKQEKKVKSSEFKPIGIEVTLKIQFDMADE